MQVRFIIQFAKYFLLCSYIILEVGPILQKARLSTFRLVVELVLKMGWKYVQFQLIPNKGPASIKRL